MNASSVAAVIATVYLARDISHDRQIRAAVEEALGLYTAERVFLNPDCGFGTFSNRPMHTIEIASSKVAAIAAAARDLRGHS